MLAVALLLRQLLLAARQLVELLQRFVDFLLLLAGGSAGGLLRLVLILLGVELEIEQAGEIAPGSAARPAASALAAKRHLNLAEGGLGPQQMLERFLLAGHGLLPLLLLQLLRGRAHGLGRRLHLFHETVEFLICLGQFAALQAAGERQRLIAQLGLHVGEEFRGFGGFLLRRFLVAQLLPGFGDDFFFALGDLVLAALPPPPPPPPPPRPAIARIRARTDRPE